jgi:hypothetical protein
MNCGGIGSWPDAAVSDTCPWRVGVGGVGHQGPSRARRIHGREARLQFRRHAEHRVAHAQSTRSRPVNCRHVTRRPTGVRRVSVETPRAPSAGTLGPRSRSRPCARRCAPRVSTALHNPHPIPILMARVSAYWTARAASWKSATARLAARAFERESSLLCQLDAVPMPDEQDDPQLVLELPDMPAERRLGQVQALQEDGSVRRRSRRDGRVPDATCGGAGRRSGDAVTPGHPYEACPATRARIRAAVAESAAQSPRHALYARWESPMCR